MSEHTEPLSFNYCEFDTNLRKGKVKLMKKLVDTIRSSYTITIYYLQTYWEYNTKVVQILYGRKRNVWLLRNLKSFSDHSISSTVYD